MALWRIVAACICMNVFLLSCKRDEIQKCDNMYIDTTTTLYAFYPNYNSISWICGGCPNKDNDCIIYCCAAAFSKDYSVTVCHDKICGPHVYGEKYYDGYHNHLINGAFIYSNGDYSFLHDSLKEKMKMHEGLSNTFGFCQMRLDTTVVSIPSDNIYVELFGVRGYRNLEGRLRISKMKFKYRALCEKDNKLCVIESKEDVSLSQFRKNIKDYGVTHALYLDTGVGWGHSWYRDNNGIVHTLHPYIHPFNTNWLVFCK